MEPRQIAVVVILLALFAGGGVYFWWQQQQPGGAEAELALLTEKLGLRCLDESGERLCVGTYGGRLVAVRPDKCTFGVAVRPLALELVHGGPGGQVAAATEPITTQAPLFDGFFTARRASPAIAAALTGAQRRAPLEALVRAWGPRLRTLSIGAPGDFGSAHGWRPEVGGRLRRGTEPKGPRWIPPEELAEILEALLGVAAAVDRLGDPLAPGSGNGVDPSKETPALDFH